MFYINSYMLKINSAGDKRYNWAVDVGDMALCPGRPMLEGCPALKNHMFQLHQKNFVIAFFVCSINGQWAPLCCAVKTLKYYMIMQWERKHMFPILCYGQLKGYCIVYFS